MWNANITCCMWDMWLYAKNCKINSTNRNAYNPMKISLEDDFEETDGESRISSSHGWKSLKWI